MAKAVEAPLNFRFSGHETFPCRYTWLPKAVRSLSGDASLFRSEDQAMVRLGVGKNMVRAIRFWSEAAGMSIEGDGGWRASDLVALLVRRVMIRSLRT
jgi:hypothetical protein